MKSPIVALMTAAAVTLVALSGSAQAPPLEKMDNVQRALPDGPVALVDDKPVTKDDFLFLYRSQLARIRLSTGGKSIDDATRVKAGIGTLAELIQREILSQLGTRRKLKVSSSEVQKAYDDQLAILIREFTDGENAPTEQDILNRSGQTRESALEDMYKSLLIEKASNALAEDKGLKVSKEEVREFYEKNKARFQRPGMLHLKQIFIRADNGKAGDDTWKKAEEAIKKAEARFQVGESFEGVAKSMSDGRDKEQGGDMGMRPTQTIPPIYVEKAGTMEVGATSEPFKSDQGWHIVRLVAREGAADIPMDEATEFIKSRLMQVKVAAAVEEYCRPILTDESRVQIFLQLRPIEEAPAKTN